LKSRNGELKDLLFSKPTILFCQKGSCSISVKNKEYICKKFEHKNTLILLDD